MFYKTSITGTYIKHSILILQRYQQIYVYVPAIGILIYMPVFFGIKEIYFNILYSANFLIVMWIFSPFYLSMFSFSSEDARSLSLFPVKFKYLVAARNILNFSLLIVAFGLSIVLSSLFYPKTSNSVPELIILSLMHLLPPVSIGNLTSRFSVSWTGKVTYSWKGLYVILILSFNILIFQISQYYFSQPVFILIIAIIFLNYIGLYSFSFQKIVRDMLTCFYSIAEK